MLETRFQGFKKEIYIQIYIYVYFYEQNTAFCLYIKHFHCIRFHLAFRISFTNICLYTLDFYVNHEN